VHAVVQSEEDRLEHEFESCPRRLVPCPWAGCEAAVRAAKLRAHRARHVLVQGIIDFTAPGVHSFTVPDNCHKMKVPCLLLLLVQLLLRITDTALNEYLSACTGLVVGAFSHSSATKLFYKACHIPATKACTIAYHTHL
jgi:hypothetical protein